MNTKGCIIGYVPQTLMFVLIATVVSSLGKNICDTRYRNIHPEHSMCKTRNYTCKFRSGIEENVQPLLDLHNHIRNSIQKVVGNNYFEGRNMMNMQWDRELYLIAQRHVLQCTDLPDCSQCHQIDRFHVEQNFAVNTFSSVNHSFNGSVERFKRVIRDWASELRKYNPCVVERFQFLGLPTNWTNIFRATTLKVGCASVTYDSQTKGRFTEIYVCNYGPALLTEGVEIYKPNYQNCNECSNNIKCNTSTPLQSRDLRQQLGDYQQRARKSQRQLIARAPVIGKSKRQIITPTTTTEQFQNHPTEIDLLVDSGIIYPSTPETEAHTTETTKITITATPVPISEIITTEKKIPTKDTATPTVKSSTETEIDLLIASETIFPSISTTESSTIGTAKPIPTTTPVSTSRSANPEYNIYTQITNTETIIPSPDTEVDLIEASEIISTSSTTEEASMTGVTKPDIGLVEVSEIISTSSTTEASISEATKPDVGLVEVSEIISTSSATESSISEATKLDIGLVEVPEIVLTSSTTKASTEIEIDLLAASEIILGFETTKLDNGSVEVPEIVPTSSASVVSTTETTAIGTDLTKASEIILPSSSSFSASEVSTTETTEIRTVLTEAPEIVLPSSSTDKGSKGKTTVVTISLTEETKSKLGSTTSPRNKPYTLPMSTSDTTHLTEISSKILPETTNNASFPITSKFDGSTEHTSQQTNTIQTHIPISASQLTFGPITVSPVVNKPSTHYPVSEKIPKPDVIWNCTTQFRNAGNCKRVAQCFKAWRVYNDGNQEYMEVDIPEQTRSGLLFLNIIYIEEPSCFIFSYKKNAVPIWSPLTSSVYGIAVRTESNDYVMVQRDTDVYDWMHVFLDIPWIKVFIQVGVGIRTDYGAGEQHIQIKDLVLRRGTCSAL